jgi:hypothetical protein
MSTWTPATGNVGFAYPHSLIYHDCRFIAFDASIGVAISEDGGGTWSTADRLSGTDWWGKWLDCAGVGAGGALVVMDTEGKAQRSTDGGYTWSAGGSADIYTERLTGNGSTVLAGGYAHAGSDGAIYRSTDGGVAWAKVLDLTGSKPYYIGYHDGVWIVGRDSGGYFGQIHRSTDDGLSWGAPINTPHHVSLARPGGTFQPVLRRGANNGAVIVLGGGSNFVSRSSDAGLTWAQVDVMGTYAGGYHNTLGGIVYDDRAGQFVMASTDSGETWLSPDGLSWTQGPDIPAGMLAQGNSIMFAALGGNRVVLLGDQGSGAATWNHGECSSCAVEWGVSECAPLEPGPPCRLIVTQWRESAARRGIASGDGFPV